MNQRSKKQRQIRLRVSAGLALFLTLALLQFSSSQTAHAQDGGQVFLPLIGNGQAIPSNIPESNAPVVSEDANGMINVAIPSGALPSASSATVVSAGNGPVALDGGQISLHWEMFSWSSGERVESSREFGEAMQMELGNAGVPTFLQDAVTGQKAGSRLMVIFEQGMHDLPFYFNQDDAYVLVVDVVAADSAALESNDGDVMAAGTPKGQGCLGNQVFLDANGNGFRDNGETNVAGIGVELVDSSGAVIESSTTNASGFYKLCAAPGDYQVRFTLTPDLVFTTPNAARESRDSDADPTTGLTIESFPIVEDVTYYDVDAGVVPAGNGNPTPTPIPSADPGCLGNQVFFDANADGFRDNGESGVANIDIELLDSNGSVVATDTTDGGGFYKVCGQPGDYQVRFILTPNLDFTVPNAARESRDSDADPATGITIQNFPIVSNVTYYDVDAGVVDTGSGGPTPTPVPPTPTPSPLASLGDKVFKDLDRDGVQDAGEPGVDGATVNLLDENGNQLDSTTTANGGMYSFTQLQPGDYIVEFEAVPNHPFTDANQGTDDAADSDADPNTGRTILFNLDAGENNPTIDAGVVNEKASLGDKVFKDLDADGVQDAGEPGIDGATVNLLDENGNQLDSTTTANGGMYSFTDLEPGDYIVEFEPVPNHPFADANQGTDDTADSDADPNTGRTAIVNLDPGENDPTIDAGVVNPAPTAICSVVADNGVAFQFAYEDVPANSVVTRNGSGIEIISGSGLFADSPGGADGTIYQYAIVSNGAVIAVCGTVTVVNPPTQEPPTPTPTDVPPTPTPTPVPPTPTPKPVLPLKECQYRWGSDILVLYGASANSEFLFYNEGESSPFITLKGSDGIPGDDGYINGEFFGPYLRYYTSLPGVTNPNFRVAVQEKDSRVSKTIDCTGPRSPIALDIDGSNAIERMDGEFSFDMTGNGEIETLSEWFAPTEGILIDSSVEGFAAGELTGQHLFGDLGGTYADGFAKLALLDANADGAVAGSEMANLVIWTDANSNAKLDVGEVSSLASHSVVSLNTSHSNFVSAATLADGSTMYMEDLWFPVVAVGASTPVSAPVSVPVAATAAAMAILLASAGAILLGSRRREALAPTQ